MGKDHLDTITIYDLSLSRSEEFPFDPRSLISKKFFHSVIAVCEAIVVVVSESTGRVIIFDEGKIIAALDPVVSTRVV